jgi:hypothetical protein
MALNRLRPGETIAGACGVLLLAVMFAPWYEIGGNLSGPNAEILRAAAARRGVDLSRDAWQSFGVIDVVMALAVLAAIGLVVLTLTQRSVALPVAASVVVTVLGALAALLVLYRLINEPALTVRAVKAPDQLIDIKLWAYLGFVLCGGIALGGFLTMADEGERLAQGERPTIPERPAPAAGGGERPAAQ